MDELFPIASGFLIGAILGWLRPSMRKWVGAPLAVVFGVLATVASGEFRVSWAYLLIDIPLVAFSATVGLLVSQRVRLSRMRAS
jgi:hypothetical protein